MKDRKWEKEKDESRLNIHLPFSIIHLPFFSVSLCLGGKDHQNDHLISPAFNDNVGRFSLKKVIISVEETESS